MTQNDQRCLLFFIRSVNRFAASASRASGASESSLIISSDSFQAEEKLIIHLWDSRRVVREKAASFCMWRGGALYYLKRSNGCLTAISTRCEHFNVYRAVTRPT